MKSFSMETASRLDVGGTNDALMSLPDLYFGLIMSLLMYCT